MGGNGAHFTHFPTPLQVIIAQSLRKFWKILGYLENLGILRKIYGFFGCFELFLAIFLIQFSGFSL